MSITEQQRAYLQRYDEFDKEPLDIHVLMKVTQQMAAEWKKEIKIKIDGDTLRVDVGVSHHASVSRTELTDAMFPKREICGTPRVSSPVKWLSGWSRVG